MFRNQVTCPERDCLEPGELRHRKKYNNHQNRKKIKSIDSVLAAMMVGCLKSKEKYICVAQLSLNPYFSNFRIKNCLPCRHPSPPRGKWFSPQEEVRRSEQSGEAYRCPTLEASIEIPDPEVLWKIRRAKDLRFNTGCAFLRVIVTCLLEYFIQAMV